MVERTGGTTFRQEFQQYCDKNGIADGSYIFKTHDYRHTLATQFYDEDVSIQTIRDYLGHFSGRDDKTVCRLHAKEN